MDVSVAVGQGSHLDVLRALRNRLAAAVDAVDTPSYALVGLSRLVVELDREVRALVPLEDSLAVPTPYEHAPWASVI
jgi:hypothetical protein